MIKQNELIKKVNYSKIHLSNITDKIKKQSSSSSASSSTSSSASPSPPLQQKVMSTNDTSSAVTTTTTTIVGESINANSTIIPLTSSILSQSINDKDSNNAANYVLLKSAIENNNLIRSKIINNNSAFRNKKLSLEQRQQQHEFNKLPLLKNSVDYNEEITQDSVSLHCFFFWSKIGPFDFHDT
jgi:hypothetical protein